MPRRLAKVQQVQFRLTEAGEEDGLETGSMQRMRGNWLALFTRMKYPTGTVTTPCQEARNQFENVDRFQTAVGASLAAICARPRSGTDCMQILLGAL
jgi:hypothetical protein